jgi:hypothetical protein
MSSIQNFALRGNTHCGHEKSPQLAVLGKLRISGRIGGLMVLPLVFYTKTP